MLNKFNTIEMRTKRKHAILCSVSCLINGNDRVIKVSNLEGRWPLIVAAFSVRLMHLNEKLSLVHAANVCSQAMNHGQPVGSSYDYF